MSPRLKKEILSESNDTEELPECIFPVDLKIIDQYQGKELRRKSKYTWLGT